MIGRALWIVLLSCAAAHAESGAWNGYRALGVSDAQSSALEFVTVEALRKGGLLDDITIDSRVTQRCDVSVNCHCEALRQRGVRYGGFGTLARLGQQWTIELTLIDAHDCTVGNTSFTNESLADADVAPRIAQLAVHLTTPPHEVARTATGTERSVDTTPAVVTTFTRTQLRELQIRTLDDLLPLVPGYEVIDTNWGGIILNQGLQNTLLFLANGVPLVNGLGNFRTLGREFRTSLTGIDRIEIVRSPGSVVWGQNAFLGVINLITDVPTRRQAGVEAGLLAGSLDTENLWVRGGQNRGSYSFVAAVDAGRRVGPSTRVLDSPQAVIGVSPIPFGNSGQTHPRPDYWLDALVRFAIGDTADFFVENLTSDINYEISPFGPLLDDGHGGYWKKTHRLYMATLSHPLYDEPGAKLTGRARASRYEYYSDENFAVQPAWPDGPEPGPMDPRDLRLGLRSLQGNDEPRVAHQLDLRVVHDYDVAFQNRLTAGIDLLHQHTPDSLATLTGIDQEPAMEVKSFGAKHFATLAAFALEELMPLPWLALSGGARLQLDKPYIAANPWRPAASFQGGAAIKRGPLGAKVIYSEGLRPPDAVQVFSTVGTKGNPELRPERSRALAAAVDIELLPIVHVRIGGDLTRISDVILNDPIVGDPTFAYIPVNKARIDIASAYTGLQLATSVVDAFVNYQITGMHESDPFGAGIPLARHTGAWAAIWRPLAALSLFTRGSFSSPRQLTVMTATDPRAPVTTSPTVRTAIGGTIADVFADVDLELSIDNPFLLEHDAPYKLDGTTTPLIERRRGTEVFVTLRYEH